MFGYGKWPQLSTVTYSIYRLLRQLWGVELVVLPNKEALTVATAILNRWICRHGLPLEFLTDQGKEFTNKMAQQCVVICS